MVRQMKTSDFERDLNNRSIVLQARRGTLATLNKSNIIVYAYLRTAIGEIKSPAERQWLHLFVFTRVFSYHFARTNMLIHTYVSGREHI